MKNNLCGNCPTRSTLWKFPALLIAVALSVGCLPGSLRAQTLGYYQFNEQAPGTLSTTNAGAILDSSGNGYNGTTPVPMLYAAGSPGYGGTSALDFNMLNDDYVDIPDPTSAFNYPVSQSFTLEALVKTTDGGEAGVGAIVGKVPSSATAPQWWFRINAGKLNFLVRSDAGQQFSVSGIATVTDGQWHHIAAVYDSSAGQLRTYVDYALDNTASASFSEGGTIGTNMDVAIGAFPADNNRYFDGDMDFVRISAAALAPANFIQAFTSITGLTPATGEGYFSPASTAGFTVISSIGVANSNVTVTVNGANISSQLAFSGNPDDLSVSLPTLAADVFYNVNISVLDNIGNLVSQNWQFSTLVSNIFSFEAEDYNFGGGQFIDNPVISSSDDPNNYFDRIGIQGIDYNQTVTPTLTQYRIGDGIATAECPDEMEPAYTLAQMSDPGVTNFMILQNDDSEWLNYTRTFPTGTYRVYARLSNPGTLAAVMRLDQVAGDTTTTNQTLEPIGTITNSPTISAGSFTFAPLTDALGNQVALSVSGVETLRLTFVTAGANVDLDYFALVPNTGTQVPFLAAISPKAGAGNVTSNAPLLITIRNADTSVNTGSVNLKIDGTTVTTTVTPTSFGATVLYTPSNLAIGPHTAKLVFSDSAATSVTNQWQFYVANQSVLAYWNFNEKTAGNFAGTNSGSIVDSSGNARNGMANDTNLQYVSGSFNYSNTTALRFTGAAYYVDVPDPSGNFIFNSSNSFTFEAVVRTTNTTTITGPILAKNGTTDGEGEYWWRLPGAVGGVQRVAIGSGIPGNEYFVVGTNVLNDGNWHHVAVVYDATAEQIRLYADYQLDGLATNAVFSTPTLGRPTDLFLGSFVNGGGSDLNGDIDFIRISSGALTAAQFIQTSVALGPLAQTLLPANGANNVSPTALIQATYLNRNSSVVLGSLKLSVDGVNVTSKSTTSSNTTTATIGYTPGTPLAAGAHTATVTFNDNAVPVNSYTNTWSFNVLATLPVLAYWQFNEQAAGTTVNTNTGAILDASGNGLNGTAESFAAIPVPMQYVTGAPAYGSTPALDFVQGNSNSVVIPDPAGALNFPATQSMTFEALVQTTNGGQANVGCVVGKVPSSSTASQWWWRINAGKQNFLLRDANNNQFSISGTTVVTNGAWHYLAAVYDSSAKQLRLYIDGASDATAVSAPYTAAIGNTTNVGIGEFIGTGNRYFNGNMDFVRITAAALDPSWFVQAGPAAAPGPLQLSNVVFTANSGQFNFATGTGHSYLLQSTTNLTTPFTNAGPIVIGNGGSSTVTLTNSSPQSFFRIRQY